MYIVLMCLVYLRAFSPRWTDMADRVKPSYPCVFLKARVVIMREGKK